MIDILNGGIFMAHNLVRTLILPLVINKIQEKYTVDENKALEIFYTSHVGNIFSEDESGLYGQSPNYIFSLFVKDFEGSQYENQTKRN